MHTSQNRFNVAHARRGCGIARFSWRRVLGHRGVLQKQFFAFVITFVTVMSGVLPSVGAEEPVQTIESLGPNTVGSTLDEVHSYKRVDECLVEEDYADCTFMEPNSGVQYVAFKKNVTSVIATEPATKTPLPFGLQFGETLSSVAKKLVTLNSDIWLLGTDHEGGIVLVSTRDYAGANGWTFHVELRFIGERLTEMRYTAGQI